MTGLLAAALLLAGPPRFLGPPEKKPADSDAPALEPGMPAPPFSAPVLISFFDPTCAVCKSELAVLDELWTQHHQRGLAVISVAADPAALLAIRNVAYLVIPDKDSTITRAYLGSKPSFPAFVIVGPDGKVRVVKRGYRGDPAVLLRAEVENALR